MDLFAYSNFIKEFVKFLKSYAVEKKDGGTTNSGGKNVGNSAKVTVIDKSTTINIKKIKININFIRYSTSDNVQLVEITDKTELLKVHDSIKNSLLLCVSCPDSSEPLILWANRFPPQEKKCIEFGKYFTCTINGKELRFWIGLQLVGMQLADIHSSNIQLAGTELADIQLVDIQPVDILSAGRQPVDAELVDQMVKPGLYIRVNSEEVEKYTDEKIICGVEPDGMGDYWIPLESGKIEDGIRVFLEELTK
jgi:hypothetical protein